MTDFFASIFDAIKEFYPVAYENGNWGACLISEGNTMISLRQEFPHGQLVNTVDGEYWIWMKDG